jgi:glycosyltransferase involved in cell wall biosynthesis
VEPTVLFIGKVVPHKGPDLLVEAARLLHEEGLRFRLRIVGGAVLSAQEGLSDFERRLRARAEPLGDRVQFEPFVDRDHIAAVYADATIMVVPSNWDEPCSLTLPEGLAAGLACVASSRGGLPEMGGAAPLYFDPPDVNALAAALRLLLTDDDERRARASAARQRAEEVTWERQLATLTNWLAAPRAALQP